MRHNDVARTRLGGPRPDVLSAWMVTGMTQAYPATWPSAHVCPPGRHCCIFQWELDSLKAVSPVRADLKQVQGLNSGKAKV